MMRTDVNSLIVIWRPVVMLMLRVGIWHGSCAASILVEQKLDRHHDECCDGRRWNKTEEKRNNGKQTRHSKLSESRKEA